MITAASKLTKIHHRITKICHKNNLFFKIETNTTKVKELLTTNILNFPRIILVHINGCSDIVTIRLSKCVEARKHMKTRRKRNKNFARMMLICSIRLRFSTWHSAKTKCFQSNFITKMERLVLQLQVLLSIWSLINKNNKIEVFEQPSIPRIIARYRWLFKHFYMLFLLYYT